jgi:hypothetical protein
MADPLPRAHVLAKACPDAIGGGAGSPTTDMRQQMNLQRFLAEAFEAMVRFEREAR